MPSTIQIQATGGLRILKDGNVVQDVYPGRPGALLGYLILHKDRPVLREAAMESLWPEVDPEAGRNRLKTLVHQLKRQLDECSPCLGEIVYADRERLRLELSAIDVDVVEFEQCLRTLKSVSDSEERTTLLSRMVRQYHGRFMHGWYDDWVLSEQDRLEIVAFRALRDLIGICEESGDLADAIELATKWSKLDTLEEDAAGTLIRLLAAAGCADESEATLKAYERLLKREGETPPDWILDLVRVKKPGSTQRRDRPSSNRPVWKSGPTEPIGGAVPLDSKYYVVRETDGVFLQALARQDSIVLIKGPRQVGKTSLLARGVSQARRDGSRIATVDLQKLNHAQISCLSSFYLACAQRIANELGLDLDVHDRWSARRGDNDNFELLMRRDIVPASDLPFVLAFDEVDRLFPLQYSEEVFSLFRSWHNERSLDPTGPWSRLTVAIVYATEAHLFIRDLNQSPFNVGTRVSLHDFGIREVGQLNSLYSSPLKNSSQLERFCELVGGNPYLVRRGLNEMATAGITLEALESGALSDEGPFFDHLRRLVQVVQSDPDLTAGVKSVIDGSRCPSNDVFYRLRAAGIVRGESSDECGLRCSMYADYLSRNLQ